MPRRRWPSRAGGPHEASPRHSCTTLSGARHGHTHSEGSAQGPVLRPRVASSRKPGTPPCPRLPGSSSRRWREACSLLTTGCGDLGTLPPLGVQGRPEPKISAKPWAPKGQVGSHRAAGVSSVLSPGPGPAARPPPSSLLAPAPGAAQPSAWTSPAPTRHVLGWTRTLGSCEGTGEVWCQSKASLLTGRPCAERQDFLQTHLPPQPTWACGPGPGSLLGVALGWGLTLSSTTAFWSRGPLVP